MNMNSLSLSLPLSLPGWLAGCLSTRKSFAQSQEEKKVLDKWNERIATLAPYKWSSQQGTVRRRRSPRKQIELL